MKIVSNLFIYPVKSLGAIEISSSNVTMRGLEYDRRWMLVDEEHRFLTQRSFHRMALLRTSIDQFKLRIFELHKEDDSLELDLKPLGGKEVSVQIWDDTCMAWHLHSAYDDWFSQKLDKKVKLVYMPDNSLRQVDLNYGRKGDITSFSDGYPILMVGQASLDDLNSKLTEPIPVQRFRPNIVFSGGIPFEEDEMSGFAIGSVEFYGVKLCGRCVITTIDQDKGAAGIEPLRTLSTYRSRNSKVLFGQNVICGSEGRISVGDKLKINQSGSLAVGTI